MIYAFTRSNTKNMQLTLLDYFTPTKLMEILIHAAAIAGIAGLNDLASNLSLFDMPSWAVAIIGIVIAQAVQGLNGYVQQHPVTQGVV